MDNTFDKMFYAEGDLLAGIDESGTCDIAGPLVAACVILPRIDPRLDDLKIFEADDSKRIPEKWRESLSKVIWLQALGIGIGEVSAGEVDVLSRQDAISLAMYRAVVATKSIRTDKLIRPNFIIVDGDFPVQINIRQALIRNADEKSLCTAAASIIAKVYRDGIMKRLHGSWPYYDWINNKGFPNDTHLRGLDKHGIAPGLHRIRRWPFTGYSARSDNVIEMRQRRRLWRRMTLEQLSKEIEEPLWTPSPKLWVPSPSFSLDSRLKVTSGEVGRP